MGHKHTLCGTPNGPKCGGATVSNSGQWGEVSLNKHCAIRLMNHTVSNSSSSLSNNMAEKEPLCSPSTRVTRYGSDLARYIVDLHDRRAVFDFCGGMMFQLVSDFAYVSFVVFS